MTTTWWILLVPVVLAPAVAAWLRRRIMRPGADLPACARCGYIVFGLPTSICPECGADLDLVGTRRPGLWVRLRPTRRLAVLFAFWTAWIWGAWCAAWEPVRCHVAPVEWKVTDGVYFRLAPDYETFLTIIRRFEGTGTLVNYAWTNLPRLRDIGWVLTIGKQPYLSCYKVSCNPCICELSLMGEHTPAQARSTFGMCRIHDRWGTAAFNSNRLTCSESSFDPTDLARWLDLVAQAQKTPTLSTDVQATYVATIDAPLRGMMKSVPFENSWGLELRGTWSSEGIESETWAFAARSIAKLVWIIGIIMITINWRRLRSDKGRRDLGTSLP